MQRLIADPQTACRTRRGRASKARVAAACFAAALLAVCLMAVTAVREPVHNLIVTSDGMETRIELKEEYARPGGGTATAPTEIETVYLPTAIPEGYTLEETRSGYAFWKKGKDVISFRQTTFNREITLDMTLAEITDIVVDGHMGIMYRESTFNILVWDAQGYLFELTYPAEIVDSEILAMAESLEAQ